MLVDGEYQPIAVNEVEWARYRGYSPALNLEICWEYGYLRWRDPATGVYLPNYDQVDDALIAERAARIAAETEAAQLREQLRRLQRE